MKRFIASLISAAMFVIGYTAFAEEYDITDNSVSGITDNTYRTVIILKENDTDFNNAVYVGQAANGTTLSSAVKFLVMDEPEDGWYVLILGGRTDNKAADRLRFYIGSSATAYGNEPYAKVWRDDDTVAFAWENVENISDYGSVLIEADGRIFGIDLSDLGNISGPVSLGMKITEVPEGTESINAYLSKHIISDGSIIYDADK